MSNHTVTWREHIDHPWLGMEPCCIGDITTGEGTPAKYILLHHDTHPALRVDAYPSSEQSFAFNDASIWRNHLIIGWGDHVYLIHLDSTAVTKHHLGSYFGHLYTDDNYLLVASADRLSRISPDASIAWRSDVLGIDGVIVNDVDGGIINGSGEWDPPGGWQSFQIRLDSGQVVKAT
ncbi:MAG: hypothetical protein GY768_33260 [Planctomycetaceae bacterium]|nr:hypothetical protein [Planctomycetaceae bacterium]